MQRDAYAKRQKPLPNWFQNIRTSPPSCKKSNSLVASFVFIQCGSNRLAPNRRIGSPLTTTISCSRSATFKFGLGCLLSTCSGFDGNISPSAESFLLFKACLKVPCQFFNFHFSSQSPLSTFRGLVRPSFRAIPNSPKSQAVASN